jgi:hypothetical protein
MSTANALRQKRHREKLKSLAAVCDVVFERYRAGALAALHIHSTDRDEAIRAMAQAVAEDVERHLDDPADLYTAAETAGAAWAAGQAEARFRRLQMDRQGTKGKRRP